MSLDARKQSSGFLTRSDTNWPVLTQKKARILKFWVEVWEGLYYPCSENKGADQLCSHCTADLHLCFRIAKILFSHDAAHTVCTAEIKITAQNSTDFVDKSGIIFTILERSIMLWVTIRMALVRQFVWVQKLYNFIEN